MQRRLFISFHHHTHTRTHTHTLQVGCSAGLSLTHSVHYAPENGNVGKKKAERGFRLVTADSHSRSVQLKFKFTFISLKKQKIWIRFKKKNHSISFDCALEKNPILNKLDSIILHYMLFVLKVVWQRSLHESLTIGG